MKGIIDGDKIGREIEQELESFSGTPKLEIILVGDGRASETFTRKKREACERVGFKSELVQLEEDVKQEKLVEEIKSANKDDSIHGILLQLPLPDHIEERKVFGTLSPEKDVDCLTPERMGEMIRGDSEYRTAIVTAVEEILKRESFNLEGKEAVIVNNSNLIGKPLSIYFEGEGATVTSCNQHTGELEKHVRRSDILVTATGVKGLIEPETIPENCLVIDAGYNRGEGDIESYEKVAEKARIAPVPGGIGPVTVAATLENLVECYRVQN